MSTLYATACNDAKQLRPCFQRTEHPCSRLDAQEEDQLCWNLVIVCLISVAVCVIGEYLHRRYAQQSLRFPRDFSKLTLFCSPYIAAQENVDLAQVAFAEGRWSDCIDHYTEVIDAGYALTSAWARRGVAKHERGDSHDALGKLFANPSHNGLPITTAFVGWLHVFSVLTLLCEQSI
jgi:hypothetical protein